MLVRECRLERGKYFAWTKCSAMGGSCETKEEGCSVVTWKTADVTALCAMGSNQGWQSEAEKLQTSRRSSMDNPVK